MRRPRPNKQRLDYIRDLRASSPYDVDDAVFGDAGIMVDDLLVEIDSVTDERDAHLADLKEARDLLEEARSTTIMEQIADRLWERVDYFWERTK